VNAELPLNEVLRGSFPWCAEWERQLRVLFAAYVEAKQAQSILDYDDLLLYWAQTASDPVLAADMGGRFDHVLVDEYQDTNRLQSSILLALKPDGAGLTVVGDDAQSIYSFRAATVRNMLDFPGAFNPPAEVVTLDRNYRSTQPILAAVNGVIDLAAESPRARFLTELTLDPPEATSDQAGVPMLDEDYLILSTIHSAKGQEWKSVFVLNVVDGCIPSDLGTGTTGEIEEERRLLHVAMTRAKDSLHLIVPQRFFTYGQSAQGDRHVYASRTRFIPAALLPLFECSAWPVVVAAASDRGDPRQVRLDIGAPAPPTGTRTVRRKTLSD
jgi:superfamily I DNA/RNA helicase